MKELLKQRSTKMKKKIVHISKKTGHFLHHSFIPGHHNNFRPKALQKKHLIGYGAVLVVVKVVVLVIMFILPSSGFFSELASKTIFDDVNIERQKAGLPILKFDERLYNAAAEKANDMVVNNYFEHISPTGVTPWYWIKKNNYIYSYAGENLAMDFFDSEELVTGWMNSRTHRENILGKNYKDAAVFLKKGTIEGSDTVVVVLMLGKQKVAAVATTQSLPAQPLAVQPTPTPLAPKEITVLPTRIPEEKVLGVIEPTPTPEQVLPQATPTPLAEVTPTFVAPIEPQTEVTLSPEPTSVNNPAAGLEKLKNVFEEKVLPVIGSIQNRVDETTVNKIAENKFFDPAHQKTLSDKLESAIFYIGTKIPGFTKAIYIYFAIFLVAAVLLNIFIHLKIQHFGTIAGAVVLIATSVVFALI
jgi:hypothetical protein